jgi:mRNA deadenylase 3'-5' endonuclease subunit Ccr4
MEGGEWQCIERADWADTPAAADELTVVSFNTLRRNYRFNQNTYTAEEHRDYDGHRRKLHRGLFCDELGKSADLLCLQEIEAVEDFDFLADTYEYVQPRAAGKKQQHAGQHSFTPRAARAGVGKHSLACSVGSV